MALVSMKKLLKKAQEQNRAVGAFSVGNMEMVMGAVKAAQELNTPIILQIAEVRLKNSPLELMGPMMLAAAKNASVDIAVHLDHGLTLETVDRALELGFTSVMFDGSLLDFEENVGKVQKVVEKASRYKASVEAELGVVGGNEGEGKAHKILCTDPEKADTDGDGLCDGWEVLYGLAPLSATGDDGADGDPDGDGLANAAEQARGTDPFDDDMIWTAFPTATKQEGEAPAWPRLG